MSAYSSLGNIAALSYVGITMSTTEQKKYFASLGVRPKRCATFEQRGRMKDSSDAMPCAVNLACPRPL